MYDAERRIVIMEPERRMTLQAITSFISRAVEECSKHLCVKILFDMRNASFDMTFMEEHELHMSLLERTGLTPRHRCAVIHTYDDTITEPEYGERVTKSRTDFAETVALNYGTKVFEFFRSYEDGLEWLELQRSSAQRSYAGDG
jgi:hypothetical protein